MKKIIFIVIVIGIIGFISWYSFIRVDKNKAIKIIHKANTSRDLATLSSMDDAYLISWAKAIRAKDPAFFHNGKTFDTQTGKSK